MERRKQPRSEVGSEAEEPLVFRHLVARQEASEKPDRDLEILDGNVLVERKRFVDQRLRLEAP
jgi:hypothetical protein